MKTSSLILPHIRKLHPYVPGEQPRVAGLVKLNTNENPYPPSPRVIRAVRKSAQSSLRLYPDPVCLRLRTVIARRFQCSPHQVLVGNGSDEILALCLRAFAGHHGRVSFPRPTYSLYPVLVQIENARFHEIPLSGSRLEPERFRAGAALTFVANPNAPTGVLVPKAVIGALAGRLRGVLVVDEAYADFSRQNCSSLLKKHSNVLITRSFSKSYSLAGMRVGFALGSRSLIEALFKVKDSYNVDRVAQAAAEAAFLDRAWLNRNVARIRRTRSRLSRRLIRLGWEVLPSEANFVFARPPEDARKVFRRLRKRKVLVRHFPGAETGKFLRITVGTDKEIDFLLRALQS